MSSFLTQNDVHLDVPLTNLTIARVQDFSGFIADQIFPRVPVQKATDKYYIYTPGDFIRAGEVKPRAPRTRPEKFSLSLSTDTYAIAQYATAFDIDFETMANEDAALDVKTALASQAMMKHMIDREVRWASTYFTSGVWATDWTGVANGDNDTATEFTQWDDYTNSDPIVEVRRAIDAAHAASYGVFRPGTMVMTRDVRRALLDNPKILSRINGGASVGNPALVPDSLLAQAFGVERILISDAMQNTAAEGLADSVSYINSKKAAIFHSPPAPGRMVASPGYIFTWSSLPTSDFGIEMKTYRGDWLEAEGIAEEVHAIVNYDMKVVGSTLGIMFNTAIS
jgi:hypothetical protein